MRVLLSGRRSAVLAELVGTALLVAAVVGSGVMAVRLTDDEGLRLMINALATVAVLGALLATFGPVSGAHLNPVITLAALVRREIDPRHATTYVIAQILGAMAGTALAHAMFELAMVSSFDGGRNGPGQLLGEVVSTAGLVVVVAACRAQASIVVPAWLGAAYFFTSSTSFANPAVTLGRAFTDTFAGIAWSDVPGFVIAQVVGGALAVAFTRTPVLEDS